MVLSFTPSSTKRHAPTPNHRVSRKHAGGLDFLHHPVVMKHPSFSCTEEVPRGPSGELRFTILPNGKEDAYTMVPLEIMLGVLMRHSYQWQPGRYQWRCSGKAKLPSLLRSNNEFPPFQCQGKLSGEIRLLFATSSNEAVSPFPLCSVRGNSLKQKVHIQSRVSGNMQNVQVRIEKKSHLYQEPGRSQTEWKNICNTIP